MTRWRLFSFVVLTGLTVALLYGLQARVAGLPPLGTLLDPADGLFRTARRAVPPADSTRTSLPGLADSVTIIRDQRHVPHIFASSDRDATIALGYVTARDRLFQLDFLPRVASGRLSEAFGAQAVSSDRFLRQTGMEWGAQKNLQRIRAADGIELQVLQWYGRGVNAYLDRLTPEDLPLEFRLLGYTPDRYAPIQALRLMQYLNYDLTYNSDDPSYLTLRQALGPSAYETLYPQHPRVDFEPIIPPGEQLSVTEAASSPSLRRDDVDLRALLAERRAGRKAVASLIGLGTHPGKGSNNWAVAGPRSASGAPLLAGDMHLSLSLPSIWYEAHLVTPTTNAYGLTLAGAPVLIQAFNEHLGWALTNTNIDLIDHLVLEVDSARQRYRFEGEWRDFRHEIDTIFVNRGPPVLDTVTYSHHGPVQFQQDPSLGGGTIAVAERWTAHDSSRTLRALWRMNRATNRAEFAEALRTWDSPMQNILYAGRDGDISIRSTGYLPIRRAGHGRGLLDGSTDAYDWVDRVPFDSLPAAHNPAQGFLASANQYPTGPDYPYYLGHDWGNWYRSLRINSLLRGQSRHGVEDFERYQADVNVQQRHVFVPFLSDLDGLSPRADSLRRMLRRWDGNATVNRPEPLVMDEFLRILRRLTWDETVFSRGPDPKDASLVHLLRTRSGARWFDVQATEAVEDGDALLAYVLEATADTMASRYGWSPSAWRWGDHHKVQFRHLTSSEALQPLGRGPYKYPGFASTLSPAAGRTVTHSASQRVIIDFSTRPPTGRGVYPGGQSGRPLDPYFYDTQLPSYLNFEYFDLRTPQAPSDLPAEVVRARRTLTPASEE